MIERRDDEAIVVPALRDAMEWRVRCVSAPDNLVSQVTSGQRQFGRMRTAAVAVPLWYAAVSVLAVAMTLGILSISHHSNHLAEPAPSWLPTGRPTPTAVDASPSSPLASRRALGLADVFHAQGEWEESRYDVGDRTGVHGIATTLSVCGESYAAELEFRLARGFSWLTMYVGQANTSRNDDEGLLIEIIANGRQQDSRRVPFGRLQPFTINVTDVNALKLRFWIDDFNCQDSASLIAVIQNLHVY